MKTKTVTFDNDNGQTLKGLIDAPSGRPAAYALFAHCFTCTKNIKAATNISKSLARAGIATLRFDFTGLGQSEGEFAETSFSSNVGDLVAAANFLAAHYQAPRLVIGHSLGGTAVLQAAEQLDSAVAVATIGSPAHPSHVVRLLAGDLATIQRDGEAEVRLAGRPFRIRKQFLDDLEAHNLPDSIARLGKALIILHSPFDDIVNIENASELFRHARHPKSFVSLDRADHLLSENEDSQYVGRVLAAWAEKYLHPVSADRTADLGGAEGETRARTALGGFRTEINAAGHRLVADEPVSVPGGTGEGPSPYDLLAAGLASCTTMTLKMYAEHKQLDVSEFTVTVRHNKIHAEDCENCETTEGKVDRFERAIAFSGKLTEAERQRVLDIADRCPVHRTLHSEVEVRTRLADTG